MAELAFDTTVNYQKIYLEGSAPFTVADPDKSSTTVIAHNLGYIPNARVWFTNASGKVCPAAGAIIDALIAGTTTDFAVYKCWYRLSTTTLSIVLDRGTTITTTATGTLYYRIYLDSV